MAIDSMFAGLFSTPDQYQQQQDQLAQAQAIQMARLTPEERAQADIRGGFQRVGNAVGGLMGVQDPQMQLQAQRRSFIQQVDMTDPKSLVQAIQASTNDPELSTYLLGKYKEIEGIRKTQAETVAKTREGNAAMLTTEQRNAAAIANSSGAERGTPAWNNTYKTELARLTAGNKGANIKEIGVAEGTRQPVYFDVGTDTQFVVRQDPTDPTKQVRVPFNGGVDRTTAKTDVKVDAKGSAAGAVEIAKLDAKRLAEAQLASDKAIEASKILSQLDKTPQGISGAGADARLAALRVFDSVGLTSSTDQQALDNADKFNSLTGERTLSFIKQLGTNPTDTDREFAKTIGPSIQKGQKTNKDLINYLRKRAQETVGSAKAMETHYYKNDYSLRGYESPFVKNVETPELTNMSADDLARAAGGRIVNGKFVKNN